MNYLVIGDYHKKWSQMKKRELEAERDLLIDKINIVPDTSRTVSEGMREVLDLMEKYLATNFK